LKYFFAPIAEGMGDLLITLPVVQALIDTGNPTYLVLRSPKQEGIAEMIAGLAGHLTGPTFLSYKLAKDDCFINMRNHPIQTEHIFGTDEFFESFGRINIVDVVGLICKDLIIDRLGIDCDWKNFQPLAFSVEEAIKDKIVFVPGSAGSFKCWPAKNWLQLHALLASRDLKVVMVGEPHRSKEVQELRDAGLEWHPTPTFADAVNVVSSARAIVTVDTGLMHLSVQQQKPTVALIMERSIFVRREPNSYPVFAPDCVTQCLGWTEAKPNSSVHFTEYGDFKFVDCSAPSYNWCMDRIDVSRVFATLKEALN
jgi:hypothetical protein